MIFPFIQAVIPLAEAALGILAMLLIARRPPLSRLALSKAQTKPLRRGR
jgi:hypothetical protein